MQPCSKFSVPLNALKLNLRSKESYYVVYRILGRLAIRSVCDSPCFRDSGNLRHDLMLSRYRLEEASRTNLKQKVRNLVRLHPT